MRSNLVISLAFRLPLLVAAVANGTTQCGLPAVSRRRPLIVNGESTEQAGEWPWHASIWHRVTQTTYVYVCGGTLLSELYVLTAGHCVSKDGNALNERLITVQLGSIQQNLLMNEFPVQNVAVVGNFLHRNFVPRSFNADISLLALRTKVTFDEYVRPVCLPEVVPKFIDDNELYGRQAVAIGFGMTETSETADVLRKITLPIVDYVTCLTSNREVFGTTLSAGVLCAGNKNGSTVCNGDSGGGLFTEDDDGRWTIRGIISFTAQRGWNDSSCSLTDYSAFVNVAFYGDWIRYVMERGEQQGFFRRGEADNEYDARNDERKFKMAKVLRISEKKCKEYRRKGLTAVKPAKLSSTKYFKNDTYTRSSSYMKHEYLTLHINQSAVGLVYYISNQHALTIADVARNCSDEIVLCEISHETNVKRVFVHPSYRGEKDFNVAILLTDPADEFLWCLSGKVSSNLYVDGYRLSSSSISRKAHSWVEFNVDRFLRTSPGAAVYNEHRDVIGGLLQNRAGEPVVMTNATAMLNWIESVVWNVTYVKENVVEIPTVGRSEIQKLRSSVAACRDYRRQGLTNVKPATLGHTDHFKNATHQSSYHYEKHNALELLKNEEVQGLVYYLTQEFAITSGQVAANCSRSVESCSITHDHRILQVLVHPNFNGGRDYSVALLRTTPADEFFWCLATEPSNQLYYGSKSFPSNDIVEAQPTWVELDLEVFIPTEGGGAVHNLRRDEIEGLLQNPAGEELVMTNVTALLDWIEPIVWHKSLDP